MRCQARDEFCEALIDFKHAVNRACEVAPRMDGIAVPAELHPLVHDLHEFFGHLDGSFPKGKKDAWLQARPMRGQLQ
jgi:hypothetical protein